MLDAQTRTQIFRFLVVGITATITDAGTYGLLLASVLDGRYAAAKSISFLAGTTVSYVLNKRWTFGSTASDPRQTVQFVVLYGLTFVVNVAVNTSLVHVGLRAGLAEAMAASGAFLTATAISTVLNFIGQKLWVFRER